MEQLDLEVKALFHEMLEGVEALASTNEETRLDLEEIKLSIQWMVGSLKGYQIFDNGKYSFEREKELAEPDLVCTIKDLSIAKKLFNDDLRDFRFKFEGNKYRFRFIDTDEGMNVVELEVPFEDYQHDMLLEFSEMVEPRRLIFLSRIPAFKRLFLHLYDPSHATGSPIPINISLGTYENQMVPLVVLEHFLKKASLRYLVDCGCRMSCECEDYNHRFGCMYIGKGVGKLDLTLPWRIEKHGHFATYEEAIEQARKAIESGLVPIMGRYRSEAALMYNLPDEGDVMTICYCCPCCCVQGAMKHSSHAIKSLFKRMEGLTVKVDPDLCVGCEDCLEVCIYAGINMEDGKAQIDQNNCLGCGRCERKCPNDAISINIDDISHVDDLIARIESYVDVS